VKILVSSQHFWPEGFRINDTVQALVKRGLDVDVLTGKPNYPEGHYYPGYRGWGCQREPWSGATLFRVPLAARGSSGAVRLVINYLSFVFFGLLCAPWLLRGRTYSAILVYGSSPILQAIPLLFLGWLKRCPVIVWVQDLWPESLEATGYVRNRHLLRAIGLVVRFIYRRTDLLLVQSRAFEGPVARAAPGKSIIYYPNSVDAVFDASETAEVPEVPGLDAGFTVVFAGNIGAGQAVDVIVEAADLLRNYPDIRFVVIGEGARSNWLRQQREKRGLENVFLPGRYPVEIMPGVLRKASALLVTLADHPAFAATVPSKVQVYMAVGKPILASLNGEGAQLIIEAGAGVVAPAGDAAALSEAVLSLYSMSPDERNRLGKNGRRYFEQHFDREMLMDQLIHHIRSVAAAQEQLA
jgi:glycosyltransferase involved in cell wall biosynthesis